LPELCASCRNLDCPTLLCSHCERTQPDSAEQVKITVRTIDIPVFAPFSYTAEVRSAIHRLKFDGHPELARRAARAVHAVLPDDLNTPLWWIPVPLQHTQLVARGFNQAALLSNELAHLTGGRSYPLLLSRNGSSAKQSRLGRQERLTNLSTAFDLSPTQRALPVGSRVVLVDDVFTTGATAIACCHVLNDCGYDVSAVVTLARVARV
jgi:ComF family protein